MAQSLAQSAIALLIELAEQGEIDPWDVQVIDVIDRFLSRLSSEIGQTQGPAAYEMNLSESGQAFLYASMLVLIKADSLARATAPKPDETEFAEDTIEDDLAHGTNLPLNLEQHLRRRAVAQPPQQRRVTLVELIDQLKLMAATLENPTPKTRSRLPRRQSRSGAVRSITELAHQENLSEMVKVLEDLLMGTHDQLLDQEWLDFEDLLQMWLRFRTQDHGSAPVPLFGLLNSPGREVDFESVGQGDRVGVFWALLLLSSQSKVELFQSEFYQELKIRRLTPETLIQLSSESDVS